jgi:hypothetical protein
MLHHGTRLQTREIVFEGFLEDDRSLYPKIGDYYALPFWEKIAVPLFLVHDECDSSVYPAESTSNIEWAL